MAPAMIFTRAYDIFDILGVFGKCLQLHDSLGSTKEARPIGPRADCTGKHEPLDALPFPFPTEASPVRPGAATPSVRKAIDAVIVSPCIVA